MSVKTVDFGPLYSESKQFILFYQPKTHGRQSPQVQVATGRNLKWFLSTSRNLIALDTLLLGFYQPKRIIPKHIMPKTFPEYNSVYYDTIELYCTLKELVETRSSNSSIIKRITHGIISYDLSISAFSKESIFDFANIAPMSTIYSVDHNNITNIVADDCVIYCRIVNGKITPVNSCSNSILAFARHVLEKHRTESIRVTVILTAVDSIFRSKFMTSTLKVKPQSAKPSRAAPSRSTTTVSITEQSADQSISYDEDPNTEDSDDNTNDVKEANGIDDIWDYLRDNGAKRYIKQTLYSKKYSDIMDDPDTFTKINAKIHEFVDHNDISAISGSMWLKDILNEYM